MKDAKTRERFIILRAQQNSFDKIAKEINVSKPTLLKWEKEFKNKISEARFLELESLIQLKY